MNGAFFRRLNRRIPTIEKRQRFSPLKSRQIPLHPPEALKKFRQREIRGPWMPGKGQIHAAKTGAGFSVADPALNLLEPKRESFCFYKNIPRLSASLGGSLGSASRSSIPPGFGGLNLPLPRTTRKAYAPPLNFFTPSLFQRGKKWKEFSLEIPQSSPPFEKRRTGGISGKAFSKR